MKAYAIKDKEGKYCQITFNGWINFVSELCCAYMYHAKQDAEKSIDVWNLSDCQVVEITIEETKKELEGQDAEN